MSDYVTPNGTEAKGDSNKNEKDESSVSNVNDIEDETNENNDEGKGVIKFDIDLEVESDTMVDPVC